MIYLFLWADKFIRGFNPKWINMRLGRNLSHETGWFELAGIQSLERWKILVQSSLVIQEKEKIWLARWKTLSTTIKLYMPRVKQSSFPHPRSVDQPLPYCKRFSTGTGNEAEFPQPWIWREMRKLQFMGLVEPGSLFHTASTWGFLSTRLSLGSLCPLKGQRCMEDLLWEKERRVCSCHHLLHSTVEIISGHWVAWNAMKSTYDKIQRVHFTGC